METRNKARLEILDYVNQFCIKHYVEGGFNYVDPESSFRDSNYDPPIGSLVHLFGVMNSGKYYLSWVVEKREEQVLLESIEDGERCWWSNVGYYHLPMELINKNPEWKWNDKQFAFRDRCYRACRKVDEYMKVCMRPEFLEDNKVIIKVRKKFEQEIITKEFDNWKNLKSKEITEFFKSVKFEN